MYSLHVTKTEKIYIQAQNEEVLDVTFDVMVDVMATDGEGKQVEGKAVLETRRLNFPLNTPAKVIKAELNKVLATFLTDEEAKEANAKLEEAHKVADATIDELTNIVIE